MEASCCLVGGVDVWVGNESGQVPGVCDDIDENGGILSVIGVEDFNEDKFLV